MYYWLTKPKTLRLTFPTICDRPVDWLFTNLSISCLTAQYYSQHWHVEKGSHISGQVSSSTRTSKSSSQLQIYTRKASTWKASLNTFKSPTYSNLAECTACHAIFDVIADLVNPLRGAYRVRSNIEMHGYIFSYGPADATNPRTVIYHLPRRGKNNPLSCRRRRYAFPVRRMPTNCAFDVIKMWASIPWIAGMQVVQCIDLSQSVNHGRLKPVCVFEKRLLKLVCRWLFEWIN